MATLNYWVSECTSDHTCYSIIGKTKKECLAKLLEYQGENWADKGYEPIVKASIKYKDAFDLFDWVTGEGGGRITGLI